MFSKIKEATQQVVFFLTDLHGDLKNKYMWLGFIFVFFVFLFPSYPIGLRSFEPSVTPIFSQIKAIDLKIALNFISCCHMCLLRNFESRANFLLNIEKPISGAKN